MADTYLLRSLDRTELQRLRDQHDVWRAETDDVLARAGFGRGDHLADLGCGPGFLSFDLAERVGPEGTVQAVDLSERFVSFLQEEARARGLAHVQPRLGDARSLNAAASSLDGVICRWFLMFLPDPARVVDAAARALRPGGRFVALEYASFRSMSLRPDGRAFRRIYHAVHELIRRNGGDADVGARAPSLATEAGLEVEEIIPFWRVGCPGSPLWNWLSRVHGNHANLVDAGLVSPQDLESFEEEWSRHAADPAAFFTAPPLLATIARKP